MKRIVIGGAGIAGLAIAHAIRERDPGADIVVLEQQQRAGGSIRTELTGGYTCEWGPHGFLDNAPATLDLVRRVGLCPRLLPSHDAARRRLVFHGDRLHEVPMGPLAFLRSGLLSFRGKARIAWEPFARGRPEEDETIHGFAARRIGEEAASVLIDSMVSGIFAGDARALSLRACFPKMWQMETDHGGLFKALLATRRTRRRTDAVGAPAGRLTSFIGGMAELVDAVAHALDGQVRLGSPLLGIRRAAADEFASSGPHHGYTVHTPHGALEAGAIVFTGPSDNAAKLVSDFDSTLASLLAGIEGAPLAVACLGYDERRLNADRGPLNGFGFLVPRGEQVRILGALWETSIYAGRAPEGKALLRVMIGGAGDPLAGTLSDDELLAVLRTDLRRTMGLAIAPEFVRIIRHRRGIPQYAVGHVARLRRIDELLQAHPGLFLAGNSYRDVALNSCITEADGIAERVLAHVTRQGQRGKGVRPL